MPSTTARRTTHLPAKKRQTPTVIIPQGLSRERINAILRATNFGEKGVAFVAQGRRLPKGARKALRKAALYKQ